VAVARLRAVGVVLAVLLAGAGVASAGGLRRLPGARRAEVVAPRDPFATRAMRMFLAGRAGRVTAAVFDVASGRTYLYRPDTPQLSASIAKVDILATLLAQTQTDGGLSAGEQELATAMIEASDNKDAQELFEEVGQLPALAALNRRFGMTQTTLNWAWGLSETTPRDQLRLLRYIVFPNRVLTTHSRKYLLSLMEHVENGQAWGISAGPGSGVTVALKNGWDPTDGIWQVNSIGMIRGDHRFYLLAVMTSQTEYAYGVATIEGISMLVWRDLREHQRPRPPLGPTGTSGTTGTTPTPGS